jgi:hypothetical protein
MKENPPSFPLSRLDQYRLALLPVAQNIEPVVCCAALAEAEPTFLNFVLSQDIGPLWYHRLQTSGLLESLPPASVNALRAARMSAAAGYLPQRMEFERIDHLFATQGIPYLVVKGAHVRECVYPDPTLRLANDIDILVSPQDRQRAARALLELCYTYHEKADSISHEALFIRGQVDIDLHWHLMRPGRTRVDMTEGFLARRQWNNGYWGLSDSDTLFLMLTHPAFVRYVCSPNMGLGRVADFLLWIQQRQLDWPAVLQLLEMAGLKAAAWTTLSWFRMLAQPDTAKVMEEWLDTLRPGRLRAAYLRYWLTHDLPTRWFQFPLLIQVGFTLFLHDRLTDVLHAVQGLWQAKRNHLRNARLLIGDEE